MLRPHHAADPNWGIRNWGRNQAVKTNRFVGLCVTLVSCAKTAELIEMPFGLRTQVGPGNHVLDPKGRGNSEGGRGFPL